MKNKELALYIHIPFCLKKCNYCDFCSFAGLDDRMKQRYVDALISEIRLYKQAASDRRVKSIFFGGGTPSLLSIEAFEKIVNAMRESFRIDGDAEFTVEANPKTLTKQKLSSFVRCGVNRLSIGLQSIHGNELKILGRIHTYQDFLDSIAMARTAGIDNINVDIMYAIPEQTVQSFCKTVDAVCALPITHLSAYSLIIEDETPFGQMRESLTLPEESDELLMVEYLHARMQDAGFSHYEISNYAKEGHACRHNLVYWNGEEYLGFGLSACSCFEKIRYANTSSMDEYLLGNFTQYRTEEHLSDEDIAFEYAMLRLRLVEGLSLEEYEKRFGHSFTEGKEGEIDKFIELGFLQCSDGYLSFTEKGIYVSNEILSRLL